MSCLYTAQYRLPYSASVKSADTHNRFKVYVQSALPLISRAWHYRLVQPWFVSYFQSEKLHKQICHIETRSIRESSVLIYLVWGEISWRRRKDGFLRHCIPLYKPSRWSLGAAMYLNKKSCEHRISSLCTASKWAYLMLFRLPEQYRKGLMNLIEWMSITQLPTRRNSQVLFNSKSSSFMICPGLDHRPNGILIWDRQKEVHQYI